ncbi:PREDICTED: uncharacterized protein LOC109179965 [Ipomoea nil]|uniref:uncharacterized protein LOC109179965 n=1 Tax=Ipomoea nil TaxID=35883 RepID=UPI000901E5A4|nr:PREDICTED: uncharacterized protein LOC109179965 [Ipomoea nil]
MSDEVLHLAVGRSTATEVWASITQALGSSSHVRCLSLLGKFQMLRQGNATTAEYLGRAQLLVESLTQAGRPLSLMEQNLYVLRGLRPELKAIAASLTASGTPVSLLHLSDFLQAHEFILVDDYPSSIEADVSPTAIYAAPGRGSQGGSGGQQSQNNRGRGSHGSQARGGRGSPRCQICRSHGHTVVYCFKRYSTQPPAQAHVAISGEAPASSSALPSDG